MLTGFRKRFLAAAVAASITFAGVAALAGVGAGGKAPPWEGKEFLNTSAVSPKSLEGKVVLLEFFGVT